MSRRQFLWRAGLIVAGSFAVGCAFTGAPAGGSIGDDDDDVGSPQGTYRSWSWNENGGGMDVGDVAPSDFFRFRADGGWLEFDGVVFSDSWIDPLDRFYIDGVQIGSVVAVVSVADTIVAGLVGTDGYFLDLYWESENNLVSGHTTTTPNYP